MPIWTNLQDRPIRVNVIVFDQFSNLCLANCIEPLRAANELAAKARYDWTYLSIDGQAVQSSSGLRIEPAAALAAAGPADLLFIISSYKFQEQNTQKTRKALRKASTMVNVVAGFDTGPWLMAAAGLLRGQRATIHPEILDAFAEQFLDTEVDGARMITTPTRVTCAGAMAAFDYASELIGQHWGQSLRLDVEGLFLHDVENVNSQRRQFAQADPMVARALAVMRDALERPMTLTELAQMADCPPKTLQRRFLSSLGAPPGHVYRHMRLSAARSMIADSALSITEISVRCGYENASALTRAFKARFGAPPSAYRQSSNKRM